MINNIKYIYRHLPGWCTDRKIIVIQSDDWFSVRTSGIDAINAFQKAGLPVERCPYMCYDHIETSSDLEQLFDVLSSIKDINGHSAIITANCLTANPDFKKIKESGLQQYFSESSLETIRNVDGAEDNIRLWVKAIDSGVCQPQCHGREHINIDRWMNALRDPDDEITRLAFKYNMYGVSTSLINKSRTSFLAAYDIGNNLFGYGDIDKNISEALESFYKIFGYKSRSFIAPNYVWGDIVERSLYVNKVLYLQSAAIQRIPMTNGNCMCKKRRYTGTKNKYGQLYLVRNVNFEPSSQINVDCVGESLREINMAFLLKKPAVISTHRVNYMGGIDPTNRERGLKCLMRLLLTARKKWPNVEFMSTTDLGDYMNKNVI